MARYGKTRTLSTAPDGPAELGWLGSLWACMVAWVTIRADAYAAEALYEQLFRLSDAELARRGLSRATLAHDACVVRGHNTEP
jgi:hypothetical protein